VDRRPGGRAGGLRLLRPPGRDDGAAAAGRAVRPRDEHQGAPGGRGACGSSPGRAAGRSCCGPTTASPWPGGSAGGPVSRWSPGSRTTASAGTRSAGTGAACGERRPGLRCRCGPAAGAENARTRGDGGLRGPGVATVEVIARRAGRSAAGPPRRSRAHRMSQSITSPHDGAVEHDPGLGLGVACRAEDATPRSAAHRGICPPGAVRMGPDAGAAGAYGAGVRPPGTGGAGGNAGEERMEDGRPRIRGVSPVGAGGAHAAPNARRGPRRADGCGVRGSARPGASSAVRRRPPGTEEPGRRPPEGRPQLVPSIASSPPRRSGDEPSFACARTRSSRCVIFSLLLVPGSHGRVNTGRQSFREGPERFVFRTSLIAEGERCRGNKTRLRFLECE